MIRLTPIDGDDVIVRKADIARVDTLGDGAIVFLNNRPPLRVLQSAEWVNSRVEAGEP